MLLPTLGREACRNSEDNSSVATLPSSPPPSIAHTTVLTLTLCFDMLQKHVWYCFERRTGRDIFQ